MLKMFSNFIPQNHPNPKMAGERIALLDVQCSRKTILISVGIGIVVLAVVIGVAVGVPLSKRAAESPHMALAKKVLSEVPLVDG